MTDEHDRSDPADRWAARARAAAQHLPESDQHINTTAKPTPRTDAGKRRLFSRPSSAAEPAPTAAVNPLLPPDASGGRGLDNDEGAGHASAGGLSAIGFEHVAGPTAPPLAPIPLNPALQVPLTWPQRAPEAVEVQLVGLHGGAGTTTVAGLLGPQAADCGVGLEELITTDVPVLFVTRTHAHGLDLALRVGQQYAARSLEPLMVLGVVVVHDAPQLSKGLGRTVRSVQKTLPNCWTVAWDEDWRHDPNPPPVATHGRLARDARRILRKAAALRESRADPPQTQTEHQQHQ